MTHSPHGPSRAELVSLREQYHRALLEDILPFWLRHSLDHRCGGSFSYLDRDGSIWCEDKPAWMLWRQLYMFSVACRDLCAAREYLEAAGRILEFMLRYGFAPSGDCYFLLARDGTPLVAPYNLYSDFFAALGLAGYGSTAGDAALEQRAVRLLQRIRARYNNPKGIWNKRLPGAPPREEMTPHTIMLGTANELARLRPDPALEPLLEEALTAIMTRFVDERRRVVWEVVAPDGSHPDTPDGRRLLPGHAVEAMGFVMREALRRDAPALFDRAVEAALWMLERGWDAAHGGILYYLDIDGKPSDMLQWSMKLWWVHAEALDTLLLAYQHTRRTDIWRWFQRVHEYTWSHFPDPAYGEWFGYLDRRGEPTHLLKGSLWKGCFHIPRALMHGVQSLEALLV